MAAKENKQIKTKITSNQVGRFERIPGHNFGLMYKIVLGENFHEKVVCISQVISMQVKLCMEIHVFVIILEEKKKQEWPYFFSRAISIPQPFVTGKKYFVCRKKSAWSHKPFFQAPDKPAIRFIVRIKGMIKSNKAITAFLN